MLADGPETDVGGLTPDAAPDATGDALPDGALTGDASPDASPDAGTPDASPDAGAPDASPDASPDAGTPDASPDAGAPDASFDAGTPDASPDAGTPDAPADAGGCGVLDPADVFVDARTTASEEAGTARCPFRTISQALALAPPTAAAPRLVHVAGGEPAVSYVEPGLLSVPPHLTLQGDGAARVLIGGVGGGGACAIVVTPSCTLSVAGGATVRDVSVTSATGSAIEVKAGTGAARFERVIATGAKLIGFAVRSDVVLDHAEATNNGDDGLDARTATVTVIASEFRFNRRHGLDIGQGATLSLTGGKMHNNTFAGINLANGSQFTVLAHTVTDADIQQNLFAGIEVSSNASLTLRGTTMFSNEMGVHAVVGSNQLDLGTAASPGNNVFGGATPGHANSRAGLCLEHTGATATQRVEGNTWRTCPPPQKKITGPFCSSNNGYSDIAYVPEVATSGAPVIPPASCTVGS